MKVLVFVTQFYRVGGAEALQVELAQRLNARRIRADVLSLYCEDLPGVPEATRALKERGIERIEFLGLVPHPSPGSLLRAAWHLRRMVIREGYDVIETSGPTATALAIVALQGTNVCHIAGIHQVFRIDRDRNSSIRVLRQLARVDRRARYYAVSQATAEAWVTFTRVAASRVRVVYNGIPDEFFGRSLDRARIRKELGIPPEARMALYVGRLAQFKGITTILEALLPILAAQNIVLVYLGDLDKHLPGSAEEVKRLQAEVDRAGLNDRVRWLGYRADVNQILKTADVLVHPTTIESFGLVLAEALAAGVPVVASNIEGIPEVLEGTDSIMVQPGDAHSLRKAVEVTLSRSPDERSRAERLGVTRAEAFRAERRIDDLLQLFGEACSGRL